jgi:acyl-coenzyme A thioesterase PaaI-like protein
MTAPNNLEQLIKQIPFAKFLGINVEQKGSELTTILNYREHLIGNPMLPALHGGVIGAFLEVTAIMQLASDSEDGGLPKPIDISFDYLRSGQARDTYGRAIIAKHGRRVANVRVEAWQEDVARPIATAHGHFLLSSPKS